MPNPYVNKVQLADGTGLIDISDTTAVASDVASGKLLYGADGAPITGTASESVIGLRDGNMITIPDGTANDKVVNFTANMIPWAGRRGTVEPTNPRPLTGYAAVKINRSGKNLFDKNNYTKLAISCTAASGSTTGTVAGVAQQVAWMQLPGGVTYAISCSTRSSTAFRVTATSEYPVSTTAYKSPNLLTISDPSADTILFAAPADTRWIGFTLRTNSATDVTTIDAAVAGLQVEVASASTEYAAFDGEHLNIAFPAEAGTVYAGTLDATTGKLTVTHQYLQFDGTETWVESTSGTYPYYYTVVTTPAPLNNSTGWSSHFPWVSIRGSSDNYGIDAINGTQRMIAVRPDSSVAASLSAFETWLSSQASAGTPLQAVYPLITPIEYTLTAADITLIDGENHLWTDTNGTNSCLYYTSAGQSQKDKIPTGGGTVSWDETANQDITIVSDNPNYFVVNNYTVPIQADETYRVTWGTGGTSYICETFHDTTGTAYDGYLFGNAGVVGGTDSGEPFLIYRDRATRLVGVANQPAGTIHIIIERQVSSGGSTLVPKTITANGTYDPADDDADGYSSVTVALSAGTEGTPTATKGSVSNHTMSVTPSVTNVGGVISGGTHTGTSVTVSASELVSGSETKTANGTYDVTNLASLVVNVSGGASNCVTGTFKGTTTGAAIDVTLNYSGTGYPVAVVIYPAEGPYNSGTGTFYGSTQRYSSEMYFVLKSEANTAPTYASSGSNNYGTIMNRYKNSTSNSTSYNASASSGVNTYRDTAAASGQTSIVKIRTAKKMSVFIASNSYGFLANIDYKYWVLYSS